MDHEPSQYDIDRLLKGRYLIDGCKSVKAECVKVQINHDKKKEKLAVSDSEGIAITKGESIVYRNSRLRDIRFDIETFAKFNREMVVAEVRFHMFKIIHVCDMCVGYEGTPPCRISCGDKSWNAKKPKFEPETTADYSKVVYDDVFFQWIQLVGHDEKGHSILLYPELGHDENAKKLGFDMTKEYEVDGVLHISFGGCPEGHGLISQYQVPARFDLHWTTDLMKEVPRLHDHLISIV
jgi:hypothetical protein